MDYRNFSPVQTTPFTPKEKIRSRIWTMINSTIFRYSPFFMNKYRVALVRLFGGRVDWSCSLNRKAVIERPWLLKMDELSSLGEDSWIYCFDSIIIGKKCCIGKNVFLLTASHDVHSLDFAYVIKPITIEDCAWIATGSCVLPGVNIGKFSVIAANSTVVKSVDDFAVVGGNPAKFLKKREINAE